MHAVLSLGPCALRRKPVLIFGEPGLEKSNIAALVHFGSPAHAAPLVQARFRIPYGVHATSYLCC